MNKFAKKLVEHSKKEDKSGRFLKNGLVELVLVRLIILLALAAYGWYVDYQEKKKIKQYFTSISAEIKPAIPMASAKAKQTDSLIIKTTNCLEILASKNRDSLPYLKSNLGPLVWVRSQEFSFPALSEFLNGTYLQKVKNKTTIKLLRQLKQQLDMLNQNHNYNTQRYLYAIEPFTNKHLNYTEVVLPYKQALLVKGGPETDYNVFFNNMELWNLLSQKLEAYKSQIMRQQNLNKLLKDLVDNLEDQIND